MNLTHDRRLALSRGPSRNSTQWIPWSATISELYTALQNVVTGTETIKEYLGMSRSQQDALKDIGGYVGGALSGPRRLAKAVLTRSLITLDLDTIKPYETENVVKKAMSLGYSCFIYNTRKHRPEAPRLRVVLPLDRDATPEEGEAVSRVIAAQIGMAMVDPTTFECNRLFYWPSVCADVEPVNVWQDGPLVPVERVLGLLGDWHDMTKWPQVPGASAPYERLKAKQGEPTEKPGIVGAFCRVYDIYSAMDTFLPGVYASCDTAGDDRFTFCEGSTTGGAVVYEHGKFLYSHHATDPCSGKLVNAFDLVRLHKFGDLDDKVAPDTPVNRLPSFSAMCEAAVADNAVSGQLAKERAEKALQDFVGVEAGTEEADPDWQKKLLVNPKTGAVLPTIDNVCVILENDPNLRGRFALNEFAGRGEILDVLPWDKKGKRRLWSDTDSNGLYWYLEKAYDITKRPAIDAALDIHSATHSFNEVKDYLTNLAWDGVPRLDTVFVDYLGAEDCDYTRAVTRKALVAAVSRVMVPGTKFDNMLILCGSQGIGKSTILDRLSKGWFNDSIRTFEGKEASELLQGVWLVEIAELDAFRRSDVARIKQFLSLRVDRYRAAYGKHVKELPRGCVFFGTCNEMTFLQDTTGNRRFWPVDVDVAPHGRSVFADFSPEVCDQIWAEAKARWQTGEPLYLSAEIEAEARERQEAHREESPQEAAIIAFAEKPVPADWRERKIAERINYWEGLGSMPGDAILTPRDRISAQEVWCELYRKRLADMKKTDAREINAVLSRMPGWQRSGPIPIGVDYGLKQRAFVKYV